MQSIIFPYLTWFRNWTDLKIALFFLMALVMACSVSSANPYDYNGGIQPGNEGALLGATWLYVHFVSMLSCWFIDREF